MKAPATVPPAKLADGDLLAAFLDPGLPVPPAVATDGRSEAHDAQSTTGTYVVKELCRPEDAYAAMLMERTEQGRRRHKSSKGSTHLTSAEVTGSRLLQAKNATSGKNGKTNSHNQHTEVKLNIGDLSFSSDEDE